MKSWNILLLICLPYLTFGLPTAIVDPKILSELQEKGKTTAILQFHGNLDLIHKFFGKLALPTRNEKLKVMYTLLKTNADTYQARALSSLEKRKQGDPDCTYHQIWAANAIVAHNMEEDFIRELITDCPQIKAIEANVLFNLANSKLAFDLGHNPIPSELLENWGFDKIETAAAHELGCTGDYVVVSNIDSGVVWEHEALKTQYRGGRGNHDYNWFDAASGTIEPTDVQGHGTHTMGTICGTKHNIGHAPRARWIACRVAVMGSIPSSNLLACGQWILCPTDTSGNNPDCTKAPHVVSNSWGSGPDNDFFNPIIAAWNSVGIANFFAIMNDGIFNVCSTGQSPGDQTLTFSVGATDEDDMLAEFSGTGPGPQGDTKPEAVAPGVNILSSYVGLKSSYMRMDGTSMATPCVAAMAALVLSVNPELPPAAVYKIIEEGSDPHAPSVRCSPTDTTELNNQYGHGRVNARKICLMATNGRPDYYNSTNSGQYDSQYK